MRTWIAIALLVALGAACAGTAEKEAAYGSPGEPAEMEDLEPEGPFDATLEGEPGE